MHDDLLRADEAHYEALDIYQRIGDRRGVSDMLRCVSTRNPDAEAHIKQDEEALQIAQEIGERWLIAAVAGNMGATLHSLGRIPEALEILNVGDEAARGGLEHLVVHLYLNLGSLQYASGQVEK